MQPAAYRYLLRSAILIVTIGFAAASFLREGMSPLQVIPTLAHADPWLAVWQPLLVVAGICGFGALWISGRIEWLRTDRLLITQIVSLLSAITMYAYDACSDSGISWLPAFGGCHCWLTGAVALIAALLSTAFLFIAGFFAIRIICEIAIHVCAYLRRIRRTPFVAHRRAALLPLITLLQTKLTTFRGPPPQAMPAA